MLKLCVGLIILVVVFPDTQQDEIDDCSEPYNEQPCLSSGGICVKADDCPKNQLARESGLCPEQQRLGIECCYGLPVSEKRCSARGGQCVLQSSTCPENLTYRDAIDCHTNEKCCILVN